MAGFNNYDQWKQEVAKLQKARSGKIKAALIEVGEFAKDAIQKRLPPGDDGRFPGYAATGATKNAFTVSRVYGNKDELRILVGLSKNASKLTQTKAFVHEYGMTIHAKRAPFLTFKVGDNWVKTKQVTIRPKHFFRDGWAETQQKFPEIVVRQLRTLV